MTMDFVVSFTKKFAILCSVCLDTLVRDQLRQQESSVLMIKYRPESKSIVFDKYLTDNGSAIGFDKMFTPKFKKRFNDEILNGPTNYLIFNSSSSKSNSNNSV